MSPDPYDGSYDLGNPQSLNRYAYVGNNPLIYTDPSGQEGVISGVTSGCFGAVASGGQNPAADVGCAIDLALDAFKIFGLFQHPKFHGSTSPRPNAHIWDEHQFSYGASPGGALGLPGSGCEFGACGGSFTGPNTSGAYPNGGDPADLNLFGSFFSALKDTIFGKKPSDRCVDEAKTAQANYVKASPHSRTIGLFGGVATSGALNSVLGGAYLGYQFGQAPIDAIYTSTLRSCTAAGH